MQTHLRKDCAATGPGLNKYQDALVLWLRWNEAHERVCKSLFAAGQDTRQIEQTLDQLDQVRREAVRMSQELLDSNS